MRSIALVLLMCIATTAQGQRSPLMEYRYCGTEPKRTATGEIHRRADVLQAFKRIHPCPINGERAGSCPGWAIDHVIPLACGGCDAVSNLQWLPDGLKSVPLVGKDRFERMIYCRPFRPVPETKHARVFCDANHKN